ncbi:MAG: alpha/beta hydrolase [Spirochaetaceae bacterium]|nr:alpha/beta hydrolase [Spirochaetaceae bacterium]
MKTGWLFIHGGWGGPWQWNPLVKRLKEQQITSFTPDFPGMGVMDGRNINLYDFIEHASRIIEEYKNPLNIAAFSFGGMTATALAGKYTDRINRLVYIDAFVPEPGQAFIDIAGEKITRQIESYSDVMGKNNMIPPFFETDARYRSHPMGTLFTAVDYSEKNLLSLNPVYIECIEKDPLWTFTPILEKTAGRIRENKWIFHTLKSDHMPMYSHREELYSLLTTE